MSLDLNTWIDIELRTRRQNIVEDDKPLIDLNTTFLQWCEELAAGRLLVDGRPFRLDNRPAMRWIYEQIPSTPKEANKKTLILQKAAQVGFTIMEVLATLYMGLKFAPAQIGMYLPDRTLAGIKSSERFMPVLTKDERKTTDEDRVRYTVSIDQYRAMQMAFAKIQRKICVFPPPDGLIQEIQNKGIKKLVSVLRERVFFHFTRTALVAQKDEEQKSIEERW